jgi:hypothetical protein
MLREPSLHPAALYRYAGPLQWGVSAVLFAGLLLIFGLLRRRPVTAQLAVTAAGGRLSKGRGTSMVRIDEPGSEP